MLCLSTLVAVTVNLWPARYVHLHSDSVEVLSDGSPEDDLRWERYFGRTQLTSKAWRMIDEANDLWQHKRYRSAINTWWQLAAAYRNTDAALAALDNISRAELVLGNSHEAVHAWEVLLMLPEVKHTEGGINLMNCRHEACVALSEYYESKKQYGFAERFASQAIFQDPIRDTCGVYSSSETIALENRLLTLRAIQGK